MTVSRQDRETLRTLAKRLAELAASPEQGRMKRRWIAHNGLTPGLPMVLAFPEGSWRELLPESEYTTAPPVRWLEQKFRMELHTYEALRDDQVCIPFCNVPPVVSHNNWGMTVPQRRTETLGSYRWDPPLKQHGDLAKLNALEIVPDAKATEERLETARELVDDILPVRMRYPGLNWPVSVADAAASFRGMDRLMLDMAENPGWVHELMGFLADTRLAALKELERNGWLTPGNENDYVGSGGVAYTDELPGLGAKPYLTRLADRWGFAEAQMLVGISPRMLDEFFLGHLMPELACYGLNCYGCCEPVHDRLDVLRKIPRLRRISVSPWADVERCAREMRGGYVFSWKPNPAALAAAALNEAAVKAGLLSTVRTCRAHGCVLEIIMKDTHTVRGDETRIPRWVTLAREAVEEGWK